MAKKLARVEIGFSGGQVAAVRLNEDELTKLQDALKKGGGWHDLDAEDGALSLDTATVAFVRIEEGDQSIGFTEP